MKTLIQGGWVVAFNGTDHEVYDNGTVVYEDDRIHPRRWSLCRPR
jgi:hypothetical protein